MPGLALAQIQRLIRAPAAALLQELEAAEPVEPGPPPRWSLEDVHTHVLKTPQEELALIASGEKYVRFGRERPAPDVVRQIAHAAFAEIGTLESPRTAALTYFLLVEQRGIELSGFEIARALDELDKIVAEIQAPTGTEPPHVA